MKTLTDSLGRVQICTVAQACGDRVRKTEAQNEIWLERNAKYNKKGFSIAQKKWGSNHRKREDGRTT